MKSLLVVLGVALAIFFQTSVGEKTSSLANGFGDDIDWVEWPAAVSTALDLDKPVFLLIHKTWCGACKALKTSFATSSKRKELVALSKRFVMTNTEDDDEPEDDEYAPDGRYIPRLYFLDKYGKRLDVDNVKNYANNAHYFPQVADVLRGMKQALKLYEAQQQASPDEPVKMPEEKETLKKDDKKKEVKKENKKEQTKRTDEKKAEKSEKETKKKTKRDEEKNDKNEEAIVVETPFDDDSLGEMHLTDDQLAFMESGGCPHAAAARAATQTEPDVDDAQASDNEKKAQNDAKKEDKEIEKKKPKKEEKKETTKKENDEKKKAKKSEL